MAKSADAFRTISEVAEWLGLPTHVLRFWESKFTQVKPVKRAGGRRYYRPNDMLLLGGIKKLLHDDGMTIKGAQKVLRDQGVKHVSALSQPIDSGVPAEAVAPAKEPLEADVVDAHVEPAAAEPEAKDVQAPDVAATPPEADAAPAPEPETAETDTAAQELTDEAPAPALQSETPQEADHTASENKALEQLEAKENAAREPLETETPSDDAPQAATQVGEAVEAPSSSLPSFLRQADSAETPAEPERAPLEANAPAQDMSDTEADVDAGLLTRLAALKLPADSQMRERLEAARIELQSLSQK